VGLAAQYGALVALSLLVLGPVLLTVIQALSPPFRYVDAGLPLHPVEVAWKDRTWFTGGAASVAARTAVAVLALAWLQRVASGSSWRALREPARAGSVVLGTVVLTVGSGPVFQSFDAADGRSGLLLAALMVAVALSQVWGFAAGPRRTGTALLVAGFVGVGVAGAAVLFTGPEVWTSTWQQYRLGRRCSAASS
jgi:hypothetical protein